MRALLYYGNIDKTINNNVMEAGGIALFVLKKNTILTNFLTFLKPIYVFILCAWVMALSLFKKCNIYL